MKAYAEYIDSGSNWLGQLPVGWLAGRLDHVAATWPSNVDKHSIVGQPAVRLCNYRDVYQNDSIIESMEFMVATATEEQIERFRLRRGDTIITKDSETADDIGVPSFVTYEAPDLICGYHLAIVRPTSNNAVPRYLYWALCSQPTRRQWAVLASGVTRVGIRSTDLSKVALPLPPAAEQRAIAVFLDRETAQIDTLIAKQETLIATLRERRVALVRHAIESADPTGGTSDRLSRRARIGNGSTPRRDNESFWLNGDHPWLNSTVVNQPRVRQAHQFVTAQALSECHLPVVPAGSVLVGLTGQGKTRGMATVLDIPATINQHLAYVTPDREYWDPDYLTWALRASYAELRLLSEENGSTKGGLTCEDLKAFRLAMPPLTHQRRIATYLDEQTGKIDTLIAKAERFIGLAKERRAALITAAVTGQIRVPT